MGLLVNSGKPATAEEKTKLKLLILEWHGTTMLNLSPAESFGEKDADPCVRALERHTYALIKYSKDKDFAERAHQYQALKRAEDREE